MLSRLHLQMHGTWTGLLGRLVSMLLCQCSLLMDLGSTLAEWHVT